MIQSNLCHIEKDRAVVQVVAWENGTQLGSCLGEGKNAEEAEERAIKRLMQRIKSQEDNSFSSENLSSKNNDIKEINKSTRNDELEKNKKNSNQKNIPNKQLYNYPNDWSRELSLSDEELKRIGWSKKEEDIYLNRAFSILNRNRITSYEVLYEYITQLRLFDIGDQPESVKIPEFKKMFLNRSDIFMTRLGWDVESGRKFLKDSLNMESRMELSKDQLIRFTVLLEEQVLLSKNKT